MASVNRRREPYHSIKNYLDINRIKQSELADVLGKSPSDINKRLNGTGADFALTEARILNGKFGIPIAYFFEVKVPLKELREAN